MITATNNTNPLFDHKPDTYRPIDTKTGEKPIFKRNSEEYNNFFRLQEAINAATSIRKVKRLLALNAKFLSKFNIRGNSLLHHVVLNCLFLDRERKIPGKKKFNEYRVCECLGSTDQFIEVAKCVIDVVPQLGYFKDYNWKTPFELMPNHPITKELKKYWESKDVIFLKMYFTEINKKKIDCLLGKNTIYLPLDIQNTILRHLES